MIEMIYRGTSKNNSKESRKALPKNIRQIGEIGDDTRIYIEDYAATFMEGTDCAVLLGEIWGNGNIKCLFVDSALKVAPEMFGDNMWEQVYRDAKEYFPGREILGWSKRVEESEEPDEETLNLHREQFPGEDRLLILHDIEGESNIYLTESTGIRQQPGYCLYYEKNEQMQNYMVKENEGKSVEAKEDVPDNAIKNFRRRIAEKKIAQKTEEENYSGRTPLMVRFLYGASMFLVLTILVIGVTMVNNYNRMKDMEMTLSEMAAAETEEFFVTDDIALAVNAPAENSETEMPEHAEEMSIPGTMTENVQVNVEQVGEQPVPADTGQTGETMQPESVGWQETAASGEGQQETEIQSQNRAAEASSAEVRKMQAEYTVREGDTLATVCRMYYGNLDKLEAICVLNDIEDPNTILPGQKIVLP